MIGADRKRKKRYRLFVFILTMIFILTVTLYLTERSSFADELVYYPVNASQDSVFTIGLIGDSWTTFTTLDTVIHSALLANNINNNTISSGEPGAKSKLVYQNLFSEKDEPYSSRFVVEKRPDYCILITGVNDAVGQVGKKFYAHHIIMIIKTLLHYKIKPIVVELPEFGIEEATDDMNFFKKERNVLSAYFNNGGQLNNIRNYREECEKEIIGGKLQDSITYIHFDPICSNFKDCTDLYKNNSHLSDLGNAKLGKIIADAIINSRPKKEFKTALP